MRISAEDVAMVTQKFQTLADLIISRGITDSPQEIQAYVDKQIETRTRKLKKLMQLRKLSAGDIRQEFLLAIIESMSRFDATKGNWRNYVSRVCNNRYCVLKRECAAETKAFGNIVPLDALQEDETDAIPTYEVDFETRGDVNIVLEKMPQRLRNIAELLKTNSPAQVVSHLKISRSTVTRAMEKIRQIFIESGFEKLHGDATN